MNNKSKKVQIEELLENQKYILDAVKNLNKRLVAIEEKMDDDKIKDLKDILESQNMIDEIIVKNSDDIELMKKVKDENEDAIKSLESKIEELDNEIQKRNKEFQNLNQHKIKENEKQLENQQIVCRYYNKGYCRRKSWCRYIHPENVCKIFLKDGKCFVRDCSSRHPKNCKYEKQACFRGDMCAYLHIDSEQTVDNQDDINNKEDLERVDDDAKDSIGNDAMNDDSNAKDNEMNFGCAHCQSDNIRNKCHQCKNYFCDKCELKVNDESILEFFQSYKFEKYTCSTVHLSKATSQ